MRLLWTHAERVGEAAKRFGDRICHVFPAEQFSFTGLRDRAVALAGAFAREYGVVGVEHPTLGQEVKAYVVLADASLTADDIRRWAGDALAPFKVPAHVEFRDTLPYNATGKIMKQQLTSTDQTNATVG